ncbi:MAG: hypothetical protein ACI4C0_02830 [Lachnospiraceae bacterium]
MSKIIKLPNLEAVKEFVKNAEELGESVLVSKVGFKYQIDGASIMGMIAVMGEKIKVDYMGESGKFLEILKKYNIS